MLILVFPASNRPTFSFSFPRLTPTLLLASYRSARERLDIWRHIYRCRPSRLFPAQSLNIWAVCTFCGRQLSYDCRDHSSSRSLDPASFAVWLVLLDLIVAATYLILIYYYRLIVLIMLKIALVMARSDH